MRNPKRSNTILIFAAVFILLAGAGWIWISRADTSTEEAGMTSVPYKGFLAPDFRLSTANGETIQLSDLRGKAVMVNVWASWCGPCRAEMPALERVYQDYRQQDFEILAVNSTIQDSPQNALSFAAEYGLTFPILFDHDGLVTKQYEVQALPSTFFIDAHGIIQEVVVGGPMSEALLRTRIEKLIKNNPVGVR
jgi:peroxiredoxin